jgi:hypothetical protein
MPKYKVLERSYLPAPGDKGNRIYEADETVDFDGLPGPNLEPLDAAGKTKQKEYFAALDVQRKVRAEQYPAMEFDMKAFAEELAKALVTHK